MLTINELQLCKFKGFFFTCADAEGFGCFVHVLWFLHPIYIWHPLEPLKINYSMHLSKEPFVVAKKCIGWLTLKLILID